MLVGIHLIRFGRVQNQYPLFKCGAHDESVDVVGIHLISIWACPKLIPPPRAGHFWGRTEGGHTWLAWKLVTTPVAREHRGVSYHLDLPKLTEANILKWADAHRGRTGDWPTRESGTIQEAPDESWAKVNSALKGGLLDCLFVPRLLSFLPSIAASEIARRCHR